MTTLHTLILMGHVVISACIIGLVLLQRGKGAEAGAAFGAGASGTVFGAKGSANFLSRTTAALATLFFVSSLTLAYLGRSAPGIAQSARGTAPAAQEAAPGLLPLPEEPAAGAADEMIDALPALPEPDATRSARDAPLPDAPQE